MSITDVAIIIPCYNPDKKFINFLNDLTKAGYENIIVINDGSKKDTCHFFNEAVKKYKCDLVSHSVNLGQGRAYKTGFNRYLSDTCREYLDTIGLIQCDCDGQHHVKDVDRCAALLREHPNKFILGVRDFTDKNIPFRSRFGNKCTSWVFKLFCGMDIKDTQTGLKGIPRFLVPTLMETPGERFEYASSVLIETHRQGVEIVQFPIKTIYINGNETSHFNPIVDSIRIYSVILRYLISSLSSFVLDVILYSLLIRGFRNAFPEYYIIISTYLSRAVLCIYVFVVNKKAVFYNKGKTFPVAVKFFLLCIVQATLSGFAIRSLVDFSGWGEVVCKIVIDTILFLASFQIQSRWVFKNKQISEKCDS